MREMVAVAALLEMLLAPASAFIPLQRPCWPTVAGRALVATPGTCGRRPARRSHAPCRSPATGAALRNRPTSFRDRWRGKIAGAARGHLAGCLRMSTPDSNQPLYEAADPSGAGEEKAGWPVASTLSEIADVEDPLTAEDSNKLFYSGTAFEFALGGVALLLGRLLDMRALGAGFDLSPESIALGLLWTIPLCVFVYSIRFLELEELKEIEAITRDFTRRLFLGRPNLALALFCFGAGFGEELLFRGVLHQKLESLFGFFPAAAMVGLGFGASHNLTPAYFTISGLTSFIFSYMFASSGSNVVVPIVAHATYDYIALKLVLREIEELDMGK